MDELKAGGRLRGLCVVASLLFFTYCVALASRSIAGFPISHAEHTSWPWLGDKPVGEDGFYMLTVADNLARTGHCVYTYGMPATGIQPLATVVFAGVAWVTNHLGGDKWTLVRAILIFGSALFLGFSWLMGWIAAGFAPPERRSAVFTLAFFLVLTDYTLFRLFTYGLETGVYLLAVAFCFVVWRRLAAEARARWSDLLLLGLGGGVAGLARIDFGLLFMFLLASLLLWRRATVLQVLGSGALALLITSPWFLFVHSVSGAWLPSSGKAESALITLHDWGRVQLMTFSALAHVVPWSFSAAATLPTTLAGVTGLALVLWVLSRAPETRRALMTGRLRATFAPWVAGLATLATIYLVLFWSAHFYARYLSPIVVVWVPVLACALAERRWVRQHPGMTAGALAVLFCAWDVAALHTGHVGSNHLISAGYINTYYPTTRVGAFQSGAIGYFDPNVENLDGKLNQGALKASAAGRLPQFIDSEGVNVLIDWPGYLHTLPSEYLQREFEPCPHPMTAPESICLVRRRLLATAR